jgi:hypothetical protein
MHAMTEKIDHLSKVSEVSCSVDAGKCNHLSYANHSGIFLCKYVYSSNFKTARAPY